MAIDRTSKFVHAWLSRQIGRHQSADFLEDIAQQLPCRVHTVLTDNGVQFVKRRGSEACKPHRLDVVCHGHGIEHRLTCPGTIFSRAVSVIGVTQRQSDLSVLIVIAASLALGSAMTQTGEEAFIADLLTRHIVSLWVALAAIHMLTVASTETMTNNAAGVLMFPVATATASQWGVDTMPYIIAIMVAASASFMTPLGYQTNLMVYGPGGYRGSDYLRLGLPMCVVVGILTIGIIPFMWRF